MFLVNVIRNRVSNETRGKLRNIISAVGANTLIKRRNDRIERELFDAIDASNMPEILRLLKLLPSPNFIVDKEPYKSPLEYTLSKKKFDIAQVLIDNGADITFPFGPLYINNEYKNDPEIKTFIDNHIGDVPPIVNCLDSLETLHQHTGQCWNDAAIVYLWFASGIGPAVQTQLRDPGLIPKFEEWIYSEDVKKKIIELYPAVVKNYNYFSYALTSYLATLKKRYDLYIKESTKGFKKPHGTLSRRYSQCFSLAGEDSGIQAATLLDIYKMPHKYEKNAPVLKERLVEATKPKVSNEMISKVSTLTHTKGFIQRLFAPILYLLMQYFLDGNIQLVYFSHEEILGSITAEAVLLFFFNDCAEQHRPFIIINHEIVDSRTRSFITTKIVSGYDFIVIKSFINIIHRYYPSFRMSMLCNAIPQSLPDANGLLKISGGHAVTFLTCQDGNQYFYDDNESILVNLNWTSIFRNMPNDFAMIYIPKYVPNPKLLNYIFKYDYHFSELTSPIFIIYQPTVEWNMKYIIHSKDKYQEYQITDKEEVKKFKNNLALHLASSHYYTIYNFDAIFVDTAEDRQEESSKNKFQITYQNDIAYNQALMLKRELVEEDTERLVTGNPFITNQSNVSRRGTVHGGKRKMIHRKKKNFTRKRR